MAGNQTRVITVKVNTPNTESITKLKKQFSDMNKTVKESANTLSSLKNIIQSVVGLSILGVGIKEITDMADSYQKLTDRITVFEGSQQAALRTMDGLAVVADRTRTSIDGIATVYSRLALSLGDTGISSKGLLFITEQLQNTFRLSGATAAEATAATIQLSQGLASGTLRGQELRSVLEQNAIVGDLLSKELGKPRGMLLKLAESGAITADVFLNALAKGASKLDSDSKKLGITFQEATDRGINKFRIALGELNREFQLSSKYNAGIETVIDNVKAFAAVLIGAATIAIPTFISRIRLLGAALVSNPLTGVLVALTSVLTYAILEWDKWSGAVLKARANIALFFATVDEKINNFGASIKEAIGLESAAKFQREGIKNIQKYKAELEKELKEIEEAKVNYAKGENPFDNFGKTTIEDQIKKFKKELEGLKFGSNDKATSPKKMMEELNRQFNDGEISVQQYNKRLLELTDIIYSKKGPNQLADALRKVEFENLNREFESGLINLQQYNIKLREMKLEEVTAKFNAARISAAEYHKEIVSISNEFRPGSAIYTGVNDYIEQSGTLSQNIAKNITMTFNTLEDTLVDFVKTGTFEFRKFATAVLDDLTRIIMRAAIIQPLAKGILGAFTGGAGGSAYDDSTGSSGMADAFGRRALGAAYANGIEYYANGGVFDKPTMFQHSKGLGVLGEAGPEAILPLTRRNGRLGVGATPVTVNIVNNSGAEIQQSERTTAGGDKVIDILITNKVKEAFANGSLDKTMSTLYNVRRKGG